VNFVLKKNHYIFIIIFCCAGFFAGAQQSVSYGYDASGNRISRTIVMSMLAPPPQDSTENIVENEEIIAGVGQDVQDTVQNNTADEEEIPLKIYTDVLAETQISIYPNPTKGLLTVKIPDLPEHSASSLTLFDMHGRVIAQKRQLSAENKLDISAQPAGTYIMQIAVGDEAVSWKIIKSEL
jgi:hypothetical protein